jgi:hypothetical protein
MPIRIMSMIWDPEDHEEGEEDLHANPNYLYNIEAWHEKSFAYE